MRIFIGIDLPNNLKNQLVNLQQSLKENGKSGNYTSFDNLHLTLLFIKECTQGQLDCLIEAMDDIKMPCFTMDVGQINFFIKKTKTIPHVEIVKSNELFQLKNMIEKAAKTCDIEFERKSFQPHITLARNFQFKQDKYNVVLAFPKQRIMIKQFHIYESTRVNQQLRYQIIESYNLIK